MNRILLLATAATGILAQTTTPLQNGASSSTTSAAPAASTTAAAEDASVPGSSTVEEGITHTIDVGLAGHTFQPDVTLANIGDTIEFAFFPTNHSVIRADYLKPCVPYEMTGRSRVGFNSDFHPVDAILEDAPTYQIRVNDTNPIFYYCGAEGSCINWQMVGVINPNASTSLERHKDAAKDSSFMLLPGEKWPDEASDPLAGDSVSGSESNSTASSDSSSSSSEAAGSTSSLSTGAIAGIAVGATLAVVAVAALIFFCGRRSRRQANAKAVQQQPLMQQPMPYSPGPHQGHMSYVQPFGDGMNKHMSMQSTSMHSPALPGYVPPQHQGSHMSGQSLYGASDALNPGNDYTQSPMQSPSMGAVPTYSQRNSIQHQSFSPMQTHSPQHMPVQQSNADYHEMPAGPVYHTQTPSSATPRYGGSELEGTETPGSRSPLMQGQQGQQGQVPQGGIMNFIKQNTGGN